MCEIGLEAQCPLELVEPATGPTTYVENIHDISATSGRIWYTAREIDGSQGTVLQGDVAAPEAATTLAVFPDGGGLSIDMPGEVHKINGPLAAGTYLNSGAFSSSADGLRMVYAGQEIAGRVDLFLVDIAGETPGAPINLTSDGDLPPHRALGARRRAGRDRHPFARPASALRGTEWNQAVPRRSCRNEHAPSTRAPLALYGRTAGRRPPGRRLGSAQGGPGPGMRGGAIPLRPVEFGWILSRIWLDLRQGSEFWQLHPPSIPR